MSNSPRKSRDNVVRGSTAQVSGQQRTPPTTTMMVTSPTKKASTTPPKELPSLAKIVASSLNTSISSPLFATMARPTVRFTVTPPSNGSNASTEGSQAPAVPFLGYALPCCYLLQYCMGPAYAGGQLWVATSVADGSSVVLKVVVPGVVSDAMRSGRLQFSVSGRPTLNRSVSRAKTEAVTLRHVSQHPFIVEFVEQFVAPDVVVTVTKHVDGFNLQQQLQHLRSKHVLHFTEAESGMIIIQLLLALQHCHALGVIHRDVEPSNIFLCKSGLLKLGDFDHAKWDAGKQPQPQSPSMISAAQQMFLEESILLSQGVLGGAGPGSINGTIPTPPFATPTSTSFTTSESMTALASDYYTASLLRRRQPSVFSQRDLPAMSAAAAAEEDKNIGSSVRLPDPLASTARPDSPSKEKCLSEVGPAALGSSTLEGEATGRCSCSKLFPVSIEDTGRKVTPYTAPELLLPDGTCTPKSDVWAAGVVLFQLATGVLPFAGQSQSELRQSIVQGLRGAEWDALGHRMKYVLLGMLNPCSACRWDATTALRSKYLQSSLQALKMAVRPHYGVVASDVAEEITRCIDACL